MIIAKAYKAKGIKPAGHVIVLPKKKVGVSKMVERKEDDLVKR